ncbi:hypothetical protein BVI434_1210014 [Burkholderia vietnamiensis]|nr:hypothetical protein BVI434_1210014 [Burkholderia vietnamiensis]
MDHRQNLAATPQDAVSGDSCRGRHGRDVSIDLIAVSIALVAGARSVSQPFYGCAAARCCRAN